MEQLKKVYNGILVSLDERPSFARDWRWLALMSLMVYAAVFAFRMSFAGQWEDPSLWVNGERILSTHDSYFWLAKAKGLGILDGYPLAKMAAFLHGSLGISYGSLGFWAPVFITSLVGVVCLLWGWLLAGRYGGLLAGLIGSLTPGFYYRSRLGYFDTDMFTLLAPLLVSFFLAYWLSKHIRSSWLNDGEKAQVQPTAPWMALGFGVAARLVSLPHADIVLLNVLMTFVAMLVLLVARKPGRGTAGFYGLLIFMLAAFPGGYFGRLVIWPLVLLPKVPGVSSSVVQTCFGLGLSGVLAFALTRSGSKPKEILHRSLVCAGAVVAVVGMTNFAVLPIQGSLKQFLTYLVPAKDIATTAADTVVRGPIYPNVVQSIIEAQQVPLADVLQRGIFTAWLAPVALLGMTVAVALRPVAVLLLPLVVLHLASYKLGFRFTMFGGAALSIFLGVGVYWLQDFLVRGLARRKLITIAVQVAAAVGILLPAHAHYRSFDLTPVITQAHAESLIELGEGTDPDAWVWTWWDWGYATQYFAGRKTVADGGQHKGRNVYPLAFALSTETPAKANRMMIYSAGYPNKPKRWMGLLPATQWNKLPRKGITQAIESLYDRPDLPPVPPQYVVVTWKDILLSQWISYFGNWDLETGQTERASIAVFNGPELAFNVQEGVVRNAQGQTGLVKDLSLIQAGAVKSRTYAMNAYSSRLMPKQQHLVVNFDLSKAVLMDDLARKSTMTRLFTADGNDPEISAHFRLVVDKLPYVRIYEVIQ